MIIGGGFTGDIQINDTHCQALVKAYYRELEIKLVLNQLQKSPEFISKSIDSNACKVRKKVRC